MRSYVLHVTAGLCYVIALRSSYSVAAPLAVVLKMPIFSFLLQGRCKFEDRYWNAHPRDGRLDQGSAASSSWKPLGQRYEQPSSFSNYLTWTGRDNDGGSFGNGSGGYRTGSSKSNAHSGFYIPQKANQDHGRDSGQDKEESPLADIQGSETWEASGQWPLSENCVQTEQRPLPAFRDISSEDLHLEGYASHKEGHRQNDVSLGQQLDTHWKQRIHGVRNWTPSSIFALVTLGQQLVTHWKQRIHGVRNWTPSSIFALLYQLIWPPTVGAQSSFGSLQESDFGTSRTSDDQAVSAATFSFKLDSPSATPNATGSFSFSSALESEGFGTAGTESASAFSFALTTSGVTASAFSGFRAASSAPTIADPGFGSSVSSGFGGTTVISGFGSSASAGATFAGTTTAIDFGGLSCSTRTSGFASATTGAISHSTPRKCLLRQDATVSSASNMDGSSATNAMLSSALFTPRNELSQENLLQFKLKKFTLGKVPLVPPPADLLLIK